MAVKALGTGIQLSDHKEFRT